MRRYHVIANRIYTFASRRRACRFARTIVRVGAPTHAIVTCDGSTIGEWQHVPTAAGRARARKVSR